MIIISLVINIINYFILFNIMPDIGLMFFFSIAYIVPIIYNSFLYLYFSSKKKENENIFLLLLPSITLISYAISAFFIVKSGKFQTFISRNTVNTDNVQINMSDNLISLSQFTFLFILYVGVLYIIKKIRGARDDKSK